ncbi:MAG: FRG domain-containing protein [Gammaproteobacteria bacterium]|nr:FRG domain-containing protein [Gammaproteobacteria bacterium]
MKTSLLATIQENFVTKTKRWNLPLIARPWFRGHEKTSWQLVPSILRNGNQRHEFELTARFRLLAPGFGADIPTDRLDQWLFVMQHNLAPTRLLDWSESLNTAVFFSCLDWITKRDVEKCSDGTVFALNPIFLNEHVLDVNGFPVTWTQGQVLQTIKFAFGTQDEPVLDPKGNVIHIPYLQLPAAIFPSTVHGRMRAQKACFTLHGADHRDMRTIFHEKGWTAAETLIEYLVPRDKKPELADDLALAGITYSTIFPDLEGLTSDLKFQFRIEP